MPKTYTAAGSATAGDVYTASAHNVIVTNVNNLIVPAACFAGANATQTGIVTATWTALTFNTERYDTDAIHDTVTNTSRFTITTPGLYLCTAYNDLSGSVAGTVRNFAVRLNGTTYLTLTQSPLTMSAQSVTMVYDLSNGDYVEFVVYQDSGVNMTAAATRTASVTWIGRTS